jgi:DNA-binding response OmpR family regulator
MKNTASSPIPTGKPMILLIGSDPALTYLLSRYAQQCGYTMVIQESVPSPEVVEQEQPSVIIFISLDQLQKDQVFMDAMSAHEIPVLVCASVSDEAQARELGADDCLLHPLTYDHFCAVLKSTCHIPNR